MNQSERIKNLCETALFIAIVFLEYLSSSSLDLSVMLISEIR